MGEGEGKEKEEAAGELSGKNAAQSSATKIWARFQMHTAGLGQREERKRSNE